MRFSFVFAALLLAACDDSVCTRNSDCKSPLVCGSINTCVLPPDMSELDGGHDAAAQDSSAIADSAVADGAETEDASQSD